jgi:hypothetical protein
VSTNPASINFRDVDLHEDRSGRATARATVVARALASSTKEADTNLTAEDIKAAQKLLARRTA